MTKRELTEAQKIANEITALTDPFNQLGRVKKLAKAFTALMREREAPAERGWDAAEARTTH
jgi:hypothetical protein